MSEGKSAAGSPAKKHFVASGSFIDRLWRTFKYEEVYLKSYQSVPNGKARLRAYLCFYNEECLHQSQGYFTPAEDLYAGTITVWRGNITKKSFRCRDKGGSICNTATSSSR